MILENVVGFRDDRLFGNPNPVRFMEWNTIEECGAQGIALVDEVYRECTLELAKEEMHAYITEGDIALAEGEKFNSVVAKLEKILKTIWDTLTGIFQKASLTLKKFFSNNKGFVKAYKEKYNKATFPAEGIDIGTWYEFDNIRNTPKMTNDSTKEITNMGMEEVAKTIYPNLDWSNGATIKEAFDKFYRGAEHTGKVTSDYFAKNKERIITTISNANETIDKLDKGRQECKKTIRTHVEQARKTGDSESIPEIKTVGKIIIQNATCHIKNTLLWVKQCKAIVSKVVKEGGDSKDAKGDVKDGEGNDVKDNGKGSDVDVKDTENGVSVTVPADGGKEKGKDKKDEGVTVKPPAGGKEKGKDKGKGKDTGKENTKNGKGRNDKGNEKEEKIADDQAEKLKNTMNSSKEDKEEEKQDKGKGKGKEKGGKGKKNEPPKEGSTEYNRLKGAAQSDIIKKIGEESAKKKGKSCDDIIKEVLNNPKYNGIKFLDDTGKSNVKSDIKFNSSAPYNKKRLNSLMNATINQLYHDKFTKANLQIYYSIKKKQASLEEAVLRYGISYEEADQYFVEAAYYGYDYFDYVDTVLAETTI